MKIIDAYSHISLPRFLSTEEMLEVMARHGVEKSVPATADTCPDLAELSRAQVEYPQKFRSIGMPVGKTIRQIIANINAQLDCGFLGIRFPESMLLEHPELLDVIGKRQGIPFVVGSRVLTDAAQLLIDFLNRYPDAHIVSPHFAGVPDRKAVSTSPAARKLLKHPRFLIAFTRQGFYPPKEVRDWAAYLVGEIGWSRLLWGSEYPVCVWRNETFDDVINWVDQVGLKPKGSDRKAFFHDNAARVLFSPRPAPKALPPLHDWLSFRKPAPVWYFPQNTLDVDEETHRRLIVAWMEAGGGKNLRFAKFLADVLHEATA